MPTEEEVEAATEDKVHEMYLRPVFVELSCEVADVAKLRRQITAFTANRVTLMVR